MLLQEIFFCKLDALCSFEDHGEATQATKKILERLAGKSEHS
jgi:hypothetical protein